MSDQGTHGRASPGGDPADERWMARALELARRGLGRVSPNPAVGAVVVRAGEVIGEGLHEAFGGPHAEVRALEAAGDAARGATIYVSLEPCRHEGKMPPCTDAVLASGFARVVYACRDPNPEAGGGGELLREKGIDVVEGVLINDARELYAYYFKHVRKRLPFVIAKWAMTADGRLGTRTGDSHWVSSDEARAAARLLRAECDVVVVGVGTVLRDDPRLTARTADGRDPLRVVLDSNLRTPAASELFSVAGAPPVIACSENAPDENERALAGRGAEVMRLPAPSGRVDMGVLLHRLYERGKLRLLVEGGATILGALFDARRVDEVRVFIAPKLVGGRSSPGVIAGRGVSRMKDALEIHDAHWEPLGSEMILRGRVGDWDWMD